MMKKEILDIRTIVTVVLVILSLAGQKWSAPSDQETGAQNPTFISVQKTVAADVK
jgi:hypothetical protein